MYIYLFLFKFMYIYLFLFIYISMYLFFLLSFFIFFSCLFIYFFIFLFIYIQYIYIYVYRIQTLDLRLPNYSPVTLRWMILQNFPLGSDISPGREKPTAGADGLAARRGTVAWCRARLIE